MPNEFNTQPLYIATGNPDTYQEASLYAAGQLGEVVEWRDRSYQLVKCDSGATASTSTGVVAANQLAFWKDRSKYLVTNDAKFALYGDVANSYRNNVAGVFRAAVTAGNYCLVLKSGRNIAVKEVGSATAGMQLVAEASSTAADALGVAINTAAPCVPLGVVRTATAATVCYADLDIPRIP